MKNVNLKIFIANKLKTLRENNFLTQEELGEKLSKIGGKKITRQAISMYEIGERKINQDLLFDLSSLFNIPISYFFPSKENEDKSKTFTILNDEDVKIDIKLNNGYDLTPNIINKALDELYKIKLEQKK